MTATIESLLANIRALRAEVHAHNVKLHEDMISRLTRRAAWLRTQGHIEQAELFDAKAAEYRSKLETYKEERGL